MTANLFIYLQALGGKFLGPNAYNNSEIKVTFRYSGGEFEIPYNVIASTNDGQISPVFSLGNSSPMPILTPSELSGQNPIVNYLTTNINTIMALSKAFDLPNTNEIAILTINIPTPSGKSLCYIESVLLIPQQEFYKITVVIPGLLVEPNATNIANNISVYVKMMCGCKVSVGLPTSFWSPSDFMVNANVIYKDGSVQSYPLSFDTQANDSLFVAPVSDAENIKSISFYAQQASTGNFGAFEEIL
jgi:hypothetical protein